MIRERESVPVQPVHNWYEVSLPPGERKQRGHFSTPPRLVEAILDACNYTPDNDLSRLRVLDPACGGGNFLACAADRLVASLAQSPTLPMTTSARQRAIYKTISRNLWGFDPDPVACFLADMQVRTVAQKTSGLYFPRKLRLHIHQADGLALPWGNSEGVDLFLANPPYLATKNSDLSSYRSAHGSGQVDSYLLFLDLALRVVRPGGWLGVVLPDPLLARVNAAGMRLRLLEHFTVHHLWHLANVFNAQVGAVVLIARKCAPDSTHPVSWRREKWSRLNALPYNTHNMPKTENTIPQSLFLRQPQAEMRYLLSSEQGAFVERLRSVWDEDSPFSQNFLPLSVFLSIKRGEELGREHGQLVEAEIPRTDEDSDSAWLPVLRGGVDTRPYATPTAEWRIARKAVVKPMSRYLSPKLLVVKSTSRLQAMLDTRGHVALQTLYLLHPVENNRIPDRKPVVNDSCPVNDDLYFFLALLNSRLLREYVYVLWTAYKWVQPQIEQHVLARLPMPVVAPNLRRGIAERARRIVNVVDACDRASPVVEWDTDMHQLYAEQEQAIRTLYAEALPGIFD